MDKQEGGKDIEYDTLWQGKKIAEPLVDALYFQGRGDGEDWYSILNCF